MGNDQLHTKRKTLEKKQAKLLQEKRKLAMLSRKARAKRFFELGGLFEEAGLMDHDLNVLRGILLDAQRHISDPYHLKTWQALSKEFIEKRDTDDLVPMIISFKKSLTDNQRDLLRNRKFRYIEFRQEWHGRGNNQELLELLSDAQPLITIVETP